MDISVLLMLGGCSFILTSATEGLDEIKSWASFILGCLFVLAYVIIRVRQLIDIIKKAKKEGAIADDERKVIMAFILESIVLFYKDMNTLMTNLVNKKETDTSELDGKDK